MKIISKSEHVIKLLLNLKCLAEVVYFDTFDDTINPKLGWRDTAYYLTANT